MLWCLNVIVLADVLKFDDLFNSFTFLFFLFWVDYNPLLSTCLYQIISYENGYVIVESFMLVSLMCLLSFVGDIQFPHNALESWVIVSFNLTRRRFSDKKIFLTKQRESSPRKYWVISIYHAHCQYCAFKFGFCTCFQRPIFIQSFCV